MSIELKPYTMMSNTVIIISAVATAVGLFMMTKSSYFLFFLWVCWMMPLIAYISGKGHGDRSMIISDDEIICNNSARVSDSQLAFGGFLDSLIIKRNDIINVDTYFYGNLLNLAASTKNLRITTNCNKDYIIDGRILDIKAVKLALDGKQQDAEDRINKQTSRVRTICNICNGFLCVFALAMGFLLSTL